MRPAWMHALQDGSGAVAGALAGLLLERLARMAFHAGAGDGTVLLALAMGLGAGMGLGSVRRWRLKRNPCTGEG